MDIRISCIIDSLASLTHPLGQFAQVGAIWSYLLRLSCSLGMPRMEKNAISCVQDDPHPRQAQTNNMLYIFFQI